MRIRARFGNPAFRYPTGFVCGLAWARDPALVWTFHRSGAALAWNRAGEIAAHFAVEGEGHQQSLRVACDQDGTAAVFARKHWRTPWLTLEAWSLQSRERLWATQLDVPDAAVGCTIEDLRLLVSAGARRVVLTGQGRDQTRRFLIEHGIARTTDRDPMAVSSDGERWVVWRDGQLVVEPVAGGTAVVLAGLDAAPRYACMPSDRGQVLVVLPDGSVGSWAASDGALFWWGPTGLRPDLGGEGIVPTGDAVWLLQCELAIVLDPSTGAELRRGSVHPGVSGIRRALAHDGRSFAVADEHQLSFVDAVTFTSARHEPEHERPVCGLALARDERRILSTDGISVRVWDRAEGHSRVATGVRRGRWPCHVVWSLDGGPAYFAEFGGLMELAGEAEAQERRFVVPTPATGPDGRMRCLVRFEPLPDDRLAVAVGREANGARSLLAVGWNPARQTVHWLHSGVRMGALARDGRTALLCGDDGIARWVDSVSGSAVAQLVSDTQAGELRVLAARSDRSGFFALCVAKDGSPVRETARLLGVRAAGTVELTGAEVVPETCLALSPDEEWLAATATCGTVALWRARTGELVEVLALEHDRAKSLVFALDGTLIVGTERGVLLEIDDPRWHPAPTWTCPACSASLRLVTGTERVRCPACDRVWQVGEPSQPAPEPAWPESVAPVVARQIEEHLREAWTRLRSCELLQELDWPGFEALAHTAGDPGRFARGQLLAVLRAYYLAGDGARASRERVLLWSGTATQEGVAELHAALERLTGLPLPAPEVMLRDGVARLRVAGQPEAEYWSAEQVALPFADGLQQQSKGSPRMQMLREDGSFTVIALGTWDREGILGSYGARPIGTLQLPDDFNWF